MRGWLRGRRRLAADGVLFPEVGDGEERCSLLGMENLSRVVLAALGNPLWFGATVNVADPQAYRMIDLVRHVSGARRVWHVPPRWVGRACALGSFLGPWIPGCRQLCDRLERFGESFSLDVSRLLELNAGPLSCLPVSPVSHG